MKLAYYKGCLASLSAKELDRGFLRAEESPKKGRSRP